MKTTKVPTTMRSLRKFEMTSERNPGSGRHVTVNASKSSKVESDYLDVGRLQSKFEE